MEQYMTPMGPTKLHVNPIFEISPLQPMYSEWLVFEGISVDEHGRQHYLDASVAYKRAVLNCIDYLSKFGYSKKQVMHFSGSFFEPPSPTGGQTRIACTSPAGLATPKSRWVVLEASVACKRAVAKCIDHQRHLWLPHVACTIQP